MLDKLYTNKTEKELKSTLNVYTSLLIVSVLMPIVLITMSYILNGKAQFKYLIIFILVFLWSLINVDYLKKRVKKDK
ncbi:hypothetical protein [Flavobacterium dankookense]|uniref:Uncharacterized protein n=1 Tax=Flavobacterium dankookense TaxID=706186 RepID=A0A4R6Q9W7_9FLAO|nr:hypothetical protein [Flavobacterium dankookense]TDP59408.1 hypothetical protein BC748_1658 [Flavobacterium dankookense]